MADLRGHLDECGLDVMRVGEFFREHAAAARDDAALDLSRRASARSMVSNARASISGPTSVPFSSGLPMGKLRIGALERRHERVVDALVHEETAQRRAALSGGADRREQDGAFGEIEFRATAPRSSHCCRRARECDGRSGRRRPAPSARPIARRARRADDRNARVAGQGLALLAHAQHDL